MSYTLKGFKISDKKFKKVIVKDDEQVDSEEEIVAIVPKNYRSRKGYTLYSKN